MDKYIVQPPPARMRAATRKPDAPHTTASASRALSHDDVARRAYSLYVKSGCLQGRSEQNWRQAEVDLRNEVVAAR